MTRSRHLKHTGRSPARAGFTWRCCHAPSARPDHPRSRGVYLLDDERVHGQAGSSPLARGLLDPAHPEPEDMGIIPARAGFTSAAQTRTAGSGDHPRSRGVYTTPMRFPPPSPGSSPLARGLRGDVDRVPLAVRIIPARAGFTEDAPDTTDFKPDHPRSRGVYATADQSKELSTGSSPLARGLRELPSLAHTRGGIIPARAGFTRTSSISPWTPWDHPRSRGVYSPRARRSRRESGSSPLARGLPPAGGARGIQLRIIPARAGFTTSCRRGRYRREDHPRSRGVYFLRYQSVA